MRYAMKQKLFCWGDDYRILDQDGRDDHLCAAAGRLVQSNRLTLAPNHE